MSKAGWIPDVPNPREQAEELVGGLIDQADGRDIAASVMIRKNDHLRANARTDPYALQDRSWRVLAVANKNPPSADYKSGTVTPEILKEVARPHRNAGKRIPRADSRRRGEGELEEVARWRQPSAVSQQS